MASPCLYALETPEIKSQPYEVWTSPHPFPETISKSHKGKATNYTKNISMIQQHEQITQKEEKERDGQ